MNINEPEVSREIAYALNSRKRRYSAFERAQIIRAASLAKTLDDFKRDFDNDKVFEVQLKS